MARNTLAEIEKKMGDLKKKRAAALEEIERKKKDAENDLSAANVEIDEATSMTDVDAYDKASEHKRKAQVAVDMYSGRLEQIRNQELISAQESDEVLMSLRKHLKGLETGFTNDAKEIIDKLIESIDTYYAEVGKTMAVYKEWCGTIRDANNIPYFPMDYKGCGLAGQLSISVRALRGSIEAKRNQQEVLKATAHMH